jgi:hypothetical protein
MEAEGRSLGFQYDNTWEPLLPTHEGDITATYSRCLRWQGSAFHHRTLRKASLLLRGFVTLILCENVELVRQKAFSLSGGFLKWFGRQRRKARLRWHYATASPRSTARARYADAFLSKDVRYVQFGIEIEGLKNVLEHLNVKLSDADKKYEEQRIQRRGTALCDPKDNGLEAERRNLVGDFRITLSRCEAILAEHSSYLRNPSSFGQNVWWEFQIQKKIDKLVNRIQFHISKVNLVTEQLQDGLLRNMAVTLDRIDRNVADIHNVVVTGSLQPTMPTTTPVPEALATRFNEALMVPHRPQAFTGPWQLPIQEGFDALVYHFNQSTVRSHGPPGSAQPLEQYINLVKAQWLVQVLKNSAQFEQSFYYKRATLRMEQLIRDEKGRSDLTRYSEADFELINATSYAIWVADEVDPGLIDDDGPGSEEQILELPLRDAPGALTVFRMSDTELRLVRPTVSSGTGLLPRDRESEISVHSHHFEPVYASPWSSEPTNQVKISSSQVRSARLYDLKEIDHVYELQRAVTGFKVVHDRMNVQWTLNKKEMSGKSRIQIWQFKPLSQANANVSQSSPSSPSDRSTNSGSSASTYQTVAEAMTEGLNPAIFSVVRNSAAGTGNETENIVLEKVPLPLLVMFTVFEKQRTFFQLERESQSPLPLDEPPPNECLQWKVVLGLTLILAIADILEIRASRLLSSIDHPVDLLSN